VEGLGCLPYLDGSTRSRIVHRNHAAQPVLPVHDDSHTRASFIVSNAVRISSSLALNTIRRVHLADSEFARCYIRLYFPCFLTSSTEHSACNATVSDTLPSTILSNPRRPCDPITIRSAFHSSAEDRIA